MSEKTKLILEHIDKYVLDKSRKYMFRYEDAPFFNLMDAVEIIKELLASQAWHPCSKEKPEKEGEYLVTALVDYGDDDLEEEVFITCTAIGLQTPNLVTLPPL